MPLHYHNSETKINKNITNMQMSYRCRKTMRHYRWGPPLKF